MLGRWVGLTLVAGALGCGGAIGGGSPVSCPVVLESCPPVEPANGAPCLARGDAWYCEYGDDPNLACDMVATCDPTTGWFVQSLGSGYCPSTLSAGCPASYAEAIAGGSTPCTPGATQFACWYPEGYCGCSEQGTVTCSPPAAAGCPSVRPRAGSACGAPCTVWGRGACDGESMKCVCGTWQPIECYD
ncbi:MAG TPA: hypothetical protein VKZ18_22925 [Polyangia bacterium]|nr:hypothetical protein [Polyangia bacterium]